MRGSGLCLRSRRGGACRCSAGRPARRSRTCARPRPRCRARRPGSGRRRAGRSAGSGCPPTSGVIMTGRWSTSCRVISQEMPPCPTTTAARSVVTGTLPPGEQVLDLAARAQVRGQLLVVAAEPAEVDDLFDAGLGRRGGEVARRLRVLVREVRRVQRVHQVVRGVHALERAAQGLRVRDVARHRGAGPGVVLGVAGHGPDLVALLDQRPAQVRADEAGRAGDEHGPGHGPSISPAPPGRTCAAHPGHGPGGLPPWPGAPPRRAVGTGAVVRGTRSTEQAPLRLRPTGRLRGRRRGAPARGGPGGRGARRHPGRG